MSRFDHNIKQYYEQQTLADDKVEAILAQTANKRRRGRYYYRAAAAAVLLIAVVGLQNHLESAALKERVLAEVAMNHRKQLDVEFVADRYLQLQQQLDRIDFSIVPQSSALTHNYRLVGGRYCSIQGQLAAQLKVEDKISGEKLTLYIAPLDDELQQLSSSDQSHSGVYIRLWQEDERFFALASTE